MKLKTYTEFINESMLSEAKYEYDPREAQRRLRDRIQTNVRRYREAQNRGDNYAIKRYELLMRLDKIDEERLKLKNELFRLKKKFKK